MFLHFPEGDTLNRDTLASSLEFAKREVGGESRLKSCLVVVAVW